MTLRNLMDVADPNTLFRVYDGVCPEPFVFWTTDYLACFEKIKEPLEPLLDRKVMRVIPDKTEDPMSPNELMPTIWVDLEYYGSLK